MALKCYQCPQYDEVCDNVNDNGIEVDCDGSCVYAYVTGWPDSTRFKRFCSEKKFDDQCLDEDYQDDGVS